MDDIGEQLARRDRLRRHLALQKTPEQRMAEMSQMQRRAWAVLLSSPVGYAHFMKRNFKARSVHWEAPDAG